MLPKVLNIIFSDVNECMSNNGGCSQHCENTEGSFACSCTIPGYELQEDGRTCKSKSRMADILFRG